MNNDEFIRDVEALCKAASAVRFGTSPALFQLERARKRVETGLVLRNAKTTPPNDARAAAIAQIIKHTTAHYEAVTSEDRRIASIQLVAAARQLAELDGAIEPVLDHDE